MLLDTYHVLLGSNNNGLLTWRRTKNPFLDPSIHNQYTWHGSALLNERGNVAQMTERTSLVNTKFDTDILIPLHPYSPLFVDKSLIKE